MISRALRQLPEGGEHTLVFGSGTRALSATLLFWRFPLFSRLCRQGSGGKSTHSFGFYLCEWSLAPRTLFLVALFYTLHQAWIYLDKDVYTYYYWDG